MYCPYPPNICKMTFMVLLSARLARAFYLACHRQCGAATPPQTALFGPFRLYIRSNFTTARIVSAYPIMPSYSSHIVKSSCAVYASRAASRVPKSLPVTSNSISSSSRSIVMLLPVWPPFQPASSIGTKRPFLL